MTAQRMRERKHLATSHAKKTAGDNTTASRIGTNIIERFTSKARGLADANGP